MRKLVFHLSCGFHPLRWCLFAVAVCLVSIVGVYDAIDLSASVAITYSSFETTFALLTDPANLAYIFLPLYLFLICGLPNQSQLGYFQFLRHRSRGQWLFYKWLTLVVYTLIFFAALFAMVFVIASQAFPYQTVWSSDFVHLQVAQGQAVANFLHPPLVTIGMSLVGTCLLYLFAGSLTMVCGLKTRSEPLSLALSLVTGLVLGSLCYYVWFVQKDLVTQGVQALLFGGLWMILVAVSRPIVLSMDIQFPKKGGV